MLELLRIIEFVWCFGKKPYFYPDTKKHTRLRTFFRSVYVWLRWA